MYIFILLNVIYLSFCLNINKKSYLFLNVPTRLTHLNQLYADVFNKAEIEACNPPIPPKKPKPPPIYNLDDPLSDFRIDKFAELRDSASLNLSSLPYVQIEHQDKNKLIPFEDGREVLSFYVNKLNSYLSNYKEWNQFYDEEPSSNSNLEFYNSISPNSFYGLVFYCAWQSESIALVKAIEQLLGKYRFIRDPPIVNKKKPMTYEEQLKDYYRIEDMKIEYEKRVEEAKKNNLPIPEEPNYENIEQVTFNLHIPDVDETKKILDYCKKKYDFNWWMPKFGKINYNRVVDKAFNELYNTSYKKVKSIKDRKDYKLADIGRIILKKDKSLKKPINLNFVFVRLANSMMLSNSRQGYKRHRRFIQCHEKEFRYNEIMMRLLLEEEIYYENMPAIQFFKCTEPLDMLPSVYGSKTQAKKPFDKHLTFYKRNPFEIAEHVSYGLPPLRKCNHLSVSNDFVRLGNFMNFNMLKTIDTFDDLFLPESDFLTLFKRTRELNKQDLSVIEPIMFTLSLMYRYQMKKIIDSRPKEPEYLILNP